MKAPVLRALSWFWVSALCSALVCCVVIALPAATKGPLAAPADTPPAGTAPSSMLSPATPAATATTSPSPSTSATAPPSPPAPISSASPTSPTTPHPLTLADLFSLRRVGDPQISPDGAWVTYTVDRADLKKDGHNTDVWMTSFDGKRTLQLTHSDDDETAPRFSPDGHWISFLSDRDYEHDTDQLWLLDRAGGEAERITDLAGGISDYVWSPNSARVALIVDDPDPEKERTKNAGDDPDSSKTPHPILLDRYQFKADKIGYLRNLHSHLYVLDLATRQAENVTPGTYDEQLPAWSPDGRSIVFVTKRGPDPDRHSNFDLYVIEAKAGATARELTTFEGADANPEWESPPVWSPDGTQIAYVQGGPDKLIYYAVEQLAVIPAAGGPARLLTPTLDRNVARPHWSPDGSSVDFLIEDDRQSQLASVRVKDGKLTRLLAGPQSVEEFAVGPKGTIALLVSTPQHPAEVYALDAGKGQASGAGAAAALRPLSRQNDALLAQLQLGAATGIEFPSKDGTQIHGLLITPPGYRSGAAASAAAGTAAGAGAGAAAGAASAAARGSSPATADGPTSGAAPGVRLPTILWLHGGPTSQYANEWRAEPQVFAAAGYAVILPNPRGSTGRGQGFATAIYADWGNKDTQDVLAAVDDVIGLGVADPQRLGVGGWSYGGILTNYVIAQDPRFKAACSGASISNVLAGYGTDMYIREYEAELGPPWKDTQEYLKLSGPFLHADRITTPTLFMCGQIDFNVPLLNSEQMYQALRSLGVPTQLVIYPGQFHGIRKPSYVRDRLERYLAWYAKYLKPEIVGAAR